MGSGPTRWGGSAGHDQALRMTVGSTGPALAGEGRLTVARPASLWRLPVETIWGSEAGCARTYAGTGTLL